VADAPPDIVEKLPTARQVVALRTQSERRRPQAKPRKAELRFYVLTGAGGQRRLSAARLARLIRGHWGIENRLHHVLDRTLREDHQRVRVGDGPQLLSLLRRAAISALNAAAGSRSRPHLPEAQQALLAKPSRIMAVLNAAYG
jgi:hypothetical protein